MFLVYHIQLKHPQTTYHSLIYQEWSVNHCARILLYPFCAFVIPWGRQHFSFIFRNTYLVTGFTSLTSLCSLVEFSFCQEEKLIHSSYFTICIACSIQKSSQRQKPVIRNMVIGRSVVLKLSGFMDATRILMIKEQCFNISKEPLAVRRKGWG